MKFEFPDSIKLAHIPTPIEKLDRLSRILEGPDIYIKRDDLTGITLTGNKVRKLEFVVAEALKQGADVLITCGGVQSNHAGATAVVAAKLGLRSYLVLRDTELTSLDGNLFLDRLMGAEVKFVTEKEYEKVDEIMETLADELRTKGHRPYVIPEGASNELGALAYIKATEEILLQLKSLNLKIDHIITAVGSGGTYAGLLMGKMMYEHRAQIHGFNVCKDAPHFVNRIFGIVENARKKYGLELGITKNDIDIIDGYVGKGYALSRQEEIDMIKKVALSEGIVLDPVYTGKAMYGLADQIRKGRFRKGETILFWHTGGIYGLFPKRSLFF
ncbi:MAG: D-cysteine desulfhydrase family protein [candidate division KSB1 bacterium]|nr:D-cysteine desulfhydrase family protein [candidate division KSB1 bacterium]